MNAAVASDTKVRILDAAELLFARAGIEATSLRQITSTAGVNLASVNYHFQSKDELIRAVYARRLRPTNAARIVLLDELEARHGETPIPLDDLIEAFFCPMIDLTAELERVGISIGKILGRFYTEASPVLEELWQAEMHQVALRFSRAFVRSLPHLTTVEALWRMHFSIGVLAHSMAAARKIQAMSQGLIDPLDRNAAMKQILAYVKAGMLAPSLEVSR